jgi:ankyrin repeat protein
MDGRRADDQQHGRLGNDYQNSTVGDNGQAVFGNIIANNCSVSVLEPQRPPKTEQEKKEDFLRSLRFDVMESRLATIGIAHRDTCSWLYTRVEYLRWQDPEFRASHHGFLWIKGKPGAGKSTLMKHALQHARGLGQRNTTIISFFFNARGHALEKTTEGMYRSLLHQVYEANPNRLPGVLPSNSSDLKDHSWQLPILQTMLRDALLNFGNTAESICYIDALDECKEDDIRLAIAYLEELGELAVSRDIKISICFASRHYPNITMRHYQVLNLDEEREHHEDIEKFVKGRLSGVGSLNLELSEEISHRSSSVFLWATLVVQILNKKMDHGATRSQLMADLKVVPAGIEDLLKSILADGSIFLLPTLLWVLFSCEPLRASKLYPAIMIGANHLTPEAWDQPDTTQEQMHLFILNSSKGLVEFSKGGYSTAQFIHESVREYLLDGGLPVLDDGLAENSKAKSHFRLATWCRNFIELYPHRGFDDSKIANGRLLDYALDYMFTHYEKACEGGSLQLEFLDAIPQSVLSRVGDYACLQDGPSLLGLLLDGQQERTCLVDGLLRRQLQHYRQVNACATARNDDIEGAIPYLDVNSSEHVEDSTLLLLALYLGDSRTIQLLLDCGADPNLGNSWDAPLLVALGNDDHDCVELLLNHGANPNIVHTHEGGATTPLATALRESSTECVEILLEHGADPNSESPDGSPLLLALEQKCCCYVLLLLHHGANPSIARTHNGVTQTPLVVAMRQRPARYVKLLLEHGADANGSGAKQERSLTVAIRNGQQDVVRMLLEHGVDANGCGAERERPLTMAIRKGQQEAVRTLLEHGADANGGNAEFGRPLTDAVSRLPCLQDIVRLLLTHGADPRGSIHHKPLLAAMNTCNEAATRLLLDADSLYAAVVTRNEAVTRSLLGTGADATVNDRMGRSYLHVLCLDCLSEDRPWKMNSIAELLLDAGVDIDATDGSHRTALIMALEMGHFGLVLLLIRRGADVNVIDAANGTALIMAAKSGVVRVVQIILDAGADVNAIDMTHRTALIIAAEMGNFGIARLLVDRGANFDMQGHEGVVRYLRLRMAEEDATHSVVV